MTTSDLPLELWLEIASYLLSGNLETLLGVSRTVFEFVMNKKYHEVHIAEGEETLRALSQLKYVLPFTLTSSTDISLQIFTRFPDIAERVRNFIIYPNFLPELHPESIQGPPSISRRRFSLWMHHKNSTPKPESPNKSREDNLVEMHKIMHTVVKAVQCCSNLTNITILMIGYRGPDGCARVDLNSPGFLIFLNLLWGSISMFTNLQNLSIIFNTTVASLGGKQAAKDPLIVVEPSRITTGTGEILAILNITTIGASQHPCYLFDDWNFACKCLISLTKMVAQSLTAISLLASDEDLGFIFKQLPQFPNLKQFELRAVFSTRSFSRNEQECLTKFLQNHSSTLGSLVIKSSSLTFVKRSNSKLSYLALTTAPRYLRSDSSYCLWLSEEPEQRDISVSFQQLILPQLHTLDIGLQGTLIEARPLPDLYHIAPMLKKLTITDVKLASEHLRGILDGLAIHDEKVILEELSYTCDDLSYQIFDTLAMKLPMLKNLTIDCATISVYSETFDDSANLRSSIAIQHTSSVKKLEKHLIYHLQKTIELYPSWPIQNIRLSSTDSRYKMHANEDITKDSYNEARIIVEPINYLSY